MMLTVSHISKKYGKKRILTDVSFTLAPGECISVIGENGCGKTTLLKILAGIMKQDQGDVLLDDASSVQARYDGIGYVPQDNPLMQELSVWDNLWLWGADRSPKTDAVVKAFELGPILKMRVSQLSDGMKRRLSIACACLKQAPIMILDEPTTALDVYYREGIRDWIRSFLSQGGSVIMTSHDEGDILLADRCYLMEDGILRLFSNEEKTADTIRSAIISAHRNR
ncbi:MAG: heme ABC exporter ATP-binding protein CcmA [Lachnospiraceae bacterium]|nr:heme ABC exporter ATP-binding protein CcmA [Lachnospiraceae bacterium]